MIVFCEPIVTPLLDCNKLKVQPNFSIPELNVSDVVNGGELKAGTYQFAIQYCSAQGDAYTSYYSVTNPTPIANPQLTTANFDYVVGQSIVLDISNIDLTGYFEYYNVAVIKTINDITSVQLVGTYFIDGSARQITYTGQDVTAISLTTADIFEKFPYYEIAQDVTAVQDILVWDQLTSIDKVNYQRIANKIDLQWQTYKIPAGENYANELNATNLRGYLRDEVYAFEIVFLLKNGKQTDGFHIPGRVANSDDLIPVDKATNNDYIGEGTTAPYWKIYNTATVLGNAIGPNIGNATPHRFGDFAYWESNEEYPCNTLVWGELAGQKIRHHKFPDVLVSPMFESQLDPNYSDPAMQPANALYPIGVKINTQQVASLIDNSGLTAEQKADIVAYKIVRGDRSTNRSIVAKGMLRNVGTYRREGTDYYYPNYPYNDIKTDPFLLEENNAYNAQCQTFKVVVTTAGTVQYTDCYSGEVIAIDMPFSMTEICSVTVPLVITGVATFTNVTAIAYTLTVYESTTSFIYTDPVTLVSANVAVAVGNPLTISSTTVPGYVSGSNKYTILEATNNKNTNCYPDNLNGFSDSSKYRMVFNSPETSFGQPYLGNILKLESALFGGGRAHFVEVKKNALYKLITKQAQVDALNSSYNIAKITGTLDATAMFTAYQAYLTIYINGISRKNFAYSFNSVAQYDYIADVQNAATDSLGNVGVKQRELDLYQYLIPGVQNVGDVNNVNNYQRESSVYLRTDDTIPALPFAEQTPSLVVAGNSLITDDSRFTISQKNNCGAPEMQEPIKVVSYYGSIKNININQWGQMYSYQTIDTGFQKNLTDIAGVETVFGGDTFIGRFAYKTKLPFFIDNRVGAPDDSDVFYDEIGNVAYPQYWHSSRSILSNYMAGTTLMRNIISVKAHFFDCPNDTTILQGTTTTTTTSASGTATLSDSTYSYDGKFYMFAYGIPYYYVESSINVDLRQAFNNLEGDFYPHVSSGIPDNWLQQSVVPINFDNTYTYNVTYSKQNKENFFAHLPVDWDDDQCYINYPFRAIYSEAQADNPSVRVNSWLNYKPVAFFDFPQNFGNLTSLDGIQNKAILARFENKSLLYNTMLTMNTSNPQAAYLGNPSLFRSAPPIDFAETDLGYVGSQNKFLLKIPNGQVTIDAKRGQVFLIGGIGGQIQDLSAFGSGLNKFFTDHLAFEILRYFPNADTDNHFNACGLHGVYDSKYDRIIISKLDYIPQQQYVGVIQYDELTGEYYINKAYGDLYLRQVVNLTDRKYFCNKSWTLSYSVNIQSWVSFHSYIPNWYIAENNFFYSGLNEGCDLEAMAIQEIPSPATTTTTTTTPLQCALDGTADYITTTTTTTIVPSDCTLTAGSAVLVTYACTLTAGSAILQ